MTLWAEAKLGDVCDLVGGGTPSKSNPTFYEGIIPWATVRDMRSELLSDTQYAISRDAVTESSTNIIKADNIVIATRVGLGKACILQQDTAINQDLKAVIPKDGRLIKPFLFQWLKSVSHVIQAAGTGATVQGVKLPFVKSLVIPLPPIPEQQRIVAILDQAFADIEKARANAEKNLKNARELFDSYLNQVFSQRGEGNQVAMPYPKARLIDCCEIKPPKSEARKLLDPDELVSFVPMASLGKYRKELILDKDKKLADVSGSYTYFAENDVLLAKITPCFENGKLGIATGLTNGIGFGSSEFIVFRPNDSLNSEYLYHFLNRTSLRAQGQLVMTGAVGHKRVPKEFIENLTIPLPPISEQKDQVNILGELSVEIVALEIVYQTKLNSLDELKKSLLQKAFSGELTKSKGIAA
jgi:type I restriction enzyme, S subunit